MNIWSWSRQTRGHGGGLVDRAADSGQYDLSSIPLGEEKEVGVCPYFKKSEISENNLTEEKVIKNATL